MKTYYRESCFLPLKDYCHFARNEDFIEITMWGNGEGFDVKISSVMGNKEIQLTFGEFEALTKTLSELT